MPESLSQITTNLSKQDLFRVCYAIEHGKVDWVKHSMYASNTQAQFKWHNRLFELTENWELVDSIYELDEKGQPKKKPFLVA